MKHAIFAKGPRAPGRRRAVLAALAVTVIWTATLLVAGCTSDPTSLVGAGLIDNQIDSTLVSVNIAAIEMFAGIRVDNPDVGLSAQQALYLGTETNTRASFLVNFDFSDIFTDEFPPELFASDSIQSIRLNLTKLLPYKATRDSIHITDEGDTLTILVPTGQPLELIYFVQELQEPFDPLLFEDYPTTLPAYLPPSIIEEVSAVGGLEPSFNLFTSDFLRWVQAGTKIGLLVRLSDQSDPGLVGYASGELKTFSEVSDLAVGTVVGPEIIVNFRDRSLNLQIPPAEDVTVFEEVEPAPATGAEAAEGFLLRTGLRSYPALRFNLSALPANALVNHAVLVMTNDVSTSYGPEFSVLVSEIVAGVMDDPAHLMEVATVLDSAQVYPLTYRANLRAQEDGEIEFDITTGIRRAVNRVNEADRGFLLSGVESKSVFSVGNFPPDVTTPDFYYRQLNFRGLNDPDPERRPHLKVWYSVVDELSGGGR